MKRFLSAIIITLLIIIIGFEITVLSGVIDYKPSLEIHEDNNEYVLTWSKFPLLVHYEVEVLNAPPNDDKKKMPRSKIIAKYSTWEETITINQNFPFRTYWRVSARGLFNNPIGFFSDAVNLAEVMKVTPKDFAQVKPQILSHFSTVSPASATPMLAWTVVPGAVFYEVELLSQPPENPNDIEPSNYRITFSREVYTNGFNANLRNYAGNHFYWRVRALDFTAAPMGVFSDAGEIVVDRTIQQPLKPLLNITFNQNGMPTPLYPAYAWIPINGASLYEVEITSEPPENPNGTEPSVYRVWSKQVVAFDCYDDEPRITPGTYYWRVRGLDEEGHTVGVFSDAQPFIVDLGKGNYSACFGDSITHGGGAISYSPANWEYSFETYLNFPTVNLGRSGDTSETMVDRFEREVLPFQPKYLIILGGTNSLRGGAAPSQVIKDLATVRDKCIANGIRPIFLTLPPINPEFITRAFNEETVPDWRERFDVVNRFIRQQRYVIDLEPYFLDADRGLPDHFAVDGLHLDIEGKKLMAQIINAHWSRVTR
ncbi:MAG: hypothetical protein H6Q65_1714 [Firmicutes bacterium]|nr:hypothetical protein [Bacillota bacterium]